MNDDQIRDRLKEVSIPQELPAKLRAIMSSTDRLDHDSSDVGISGVDSDCHRASSSEMTTSRNISDRRLPGRFWLQPSVLVGVSTAAGILVALFLWFSQTENHSVAHHPLPENQVSSAEATDSGGHDPLGNEVNRADLRELELLHARIEAIRLELLNDEIRELENRRDQLARLQAGRQNRYQESMLTANLVSQVFETSDLSQSHLENDLLTNVIGIFRESSALKVSQSTFN